MATINTPHQSSDDDEDDDEAEDHEAEAAAEHAEQKDAHPQLPFGSSAPVRPSHAHSLPSTASSSSLPRAPSPESSSLALIPFSGPLGGIHAFSPQSGTEVLPDSNAPISKPSTRDDRQSIFCTPSIPKHGLDSVTIDPDRGPVKKYEIKEHKKRSKNWTRAETLTLIRLRTDFAPRFAKAVRKIELWDEIARSMQKGPFFRDAQQCRDKWEKLMAGYKEVRDGVKNKDDNPYFEDLHPVLSGRGSKRERELDMANDQPHADKIEAFKKSAPFVAGNATHPPPTAPLSQYQQIPYIWNSSMDTNYGQPVRAVLLDSHNPAIAGIAADNYDQHQSVLKNLAMDGRHPPPILDGLSFRSKFGERQFARSTAMECGIARADDSGNDDEEGSEDFTHSAKRKQSKLSYLADLRAVQGLLEPILVKQQIFLKELLVGLEKKEEIREQRRWEREEKWRAEERAQHLFFTETMQTLLQKLGTHNVAVEGSSLGVSTPVPADCMPPVCSPVDANLALKKRSKNWKRSEVLQLIKLRAEMEERFAKSMRRAALWVEISELLSVEGVRRDGKQCREKWDKLISEYKDVVDGKKERGDSPYFPDMQAALARTGSNTERDVDVSGVVSETNAVHT